MGFCRAITGFRDLAVLGVGPASRAIVKPVNWAIGTPSHTAVRLAERRHGPAHVARAPVVGNVRPPTHSVGGF